MKQLSLPEALSLVHAVLDESARRSAGNSIAYLPGEVRLREDLEFDSLAILEVVMALEDALDFQLPDNDARHIITLGDLRQYIDDRIHGRPVQVANKERYDRERLWAVMPQEPSALYLLTAEVQGETVRATCQFAECAVASHSGNLESLLVESSFQAAQLWLLEQVHSRLPDAALKSGLHLRGSPRLVGSATFCLSAELQLKLTLTALETDHAIFQGEIYRQQDLLRTVEFLAIEWTLPPA